MNDIPLSSLPRKSFALPMPHLHEPSPCARHCFAHAQAIALRMRAPLLCACAGHYTAHVHNSCPVGERLVGACSHCVTALTLASVYPGHPNEFCSTHRGVQLVDRKNPQQMDIATVSEVS